MICERCQESIEGDMYNVGWHWDNKEKDGPFCQQVSSFKLKAFFCANCVAEVNDIILGGKDAEKG